VKKRNVLRYESVVN